MFFVKEAKIQHHRCFSKVYYYVKIVAQAWYWCHVWIQLLYANNRNTLRCLVLGLSQDEASADFDKTLGVNSYVDLQYLFLPLSTHFFFRWTVPLNWLCINRLLHTWAIRANKLLKIYACIRTWKSELVTGIFGMCTNCAHCGRQYWIENQGDPCYVSSFYWQLANVENISYSST